MHKLAQIVRLLEAGEGNHTAGRQISSEPAA